MSIIKPTLGELVDRFSILELKRLHAPGELTEEYLALEERLGPLVSDVVKLACRNALLWEMRDAAVDGAPITLSDADRENAARRQLVRAIDASTPPTPPRQL